MNFIKGFINVIWIIATIAAVGAGSVIVIGSLGKLIFEGSGSMFNSAKEWSLFLIIIPLLYTVIRNCTNLKKPFSNKEVSYSDRRRYEI